MSLSGVELWKLHYDSIEASVLILVILRAKKCTKIQISKITFFSQYNTYISKKEILVAPYVLWSESISMDLLYLFHSFLPPP